MNNEFNLTNTEEMVGQDPVDFPSRDNLNLKWDKNLETWVIDGGITAYCHLYGPPVDKLPSRTQSIIWDSPADTSGATTDKQYNSVADFEYNKEIMLSHLYILGFSDADMGGISIDEIIKKVREVYKYKQVAHEFASQSFIKRKNIAMVRGIRRANHRMQVANNGS